MPVCVQICRPSSACARIGAFLPFFAILLNGSVFKTLTFCLLLSGSRSEKNHKVP